MDKAIISKVNKNAIYEIYRACRLCGAGAGYKMPIIQNVLDIDGDEVELRHKIQECVHIEVSQDDKMPPLICELCVDKVNDFYDFIELCRKTNKHTRLTLGLPLQTAKKGKSDSSDCILGVTEPVYISRADDSRSSPRHTKSKLVKDNKSVMKKPEVKIKVEPKTSDHRDSRDTRNSRSKRERSPSPPPSPRATRKSRSSIEENLSLSSLKTQSKKLKKLHSPPPPPPPPPKSILKKTVKIEVPSSSKSTRSREPPKPEIPLKKVKLAVKPVVKSTKAAPPSPPAVVCNICKTHFKNQQGLSSHVRLHGVQFTSPKLACNSCGEWFDTVDNASAHHKRHKSKPYICRGCRRSYKTLEAYEDHVEVAKCVPWKEVPDVKCVKCWATFPTRTLMKQHRCPGVDGRKGGKCLKCNRFYALFKNLTKHKSICYGRKGKPKINRELMKKVRPIKILVSKCDPILKRKIGRYYDVTNVAEYYGLDSNSVYPYLRSRSLHLNKMVSIMSELDEFYCEEDYIHWDSDISNDDTDGESDMKVDSLCTLSLKTIFSRKCLGRVPKKRRKIKTEKEAFDSLMNTDFDNSLSKDIDNIIENLGMQNDNNDSDDKTSDSIIANVKDGNSNVVKVATEFNNSFNSNGEESSEYHKDLNTNEGRLGHNENSRNDDGEGNDMLIGEKIGDSFIENEQDNVSVNSDSLFKDNEAMNDLDFGTPDESDEQTVRHTEKSDDSVSKSNPENIFGVSEDKDDKHLDISIANGCESMAKAEEEKCNDKHDSEMTEASYGNEISLNERISPTERRESRSENSDVSNEICDENVKNDSSQTSNQENTDHVSEIGIVCQKDEHTKESCDDDTNNDDTEHHINSNDNSNLDDNINSLDKESNEEDSRNLNGISEDFDQDKFNTGDDASGSDIDDSKLMAALDEHIGENISIANEAQSGSAEEGKECIAEINDSAKCKDNSTKSCNDKITLDDLIPEKSADSKSMDLDSISDDEFNFD